MKNSNDCKNCIHAVLFLETCKRSCGDNTSIEAELIEGCEFCRGEKVIGDAEYNMTVCKNDKTNDNYIVFTFNSDHYDDWGEWNNKINYCPMCGRKLVE